MTTTMIIDDGDGDGAAAAADGDDWRNGYQW